MVVGVRWEDETTTTYVEYKIYTCEAGLVDEIRTAVNIHEFDSVNGLSDAAVQIMEMVADQDDRTPLEAARDYWN